MFNIAQLTLERDRISPVVHPRDFHGPHTFCSGETKISSRGSAPRLLTCQESTTKQRVCAPGESPKGWCSVLLDPRQDAWTGSPGADREATRASPGRQGRWNGSVPLAEEHSQMLEVRLAEPASDGK